ncbi:hypothetical protein [Spiroplasma turonicum]|uniref:Uncharacterized protein n=1 Tax=Spiroplasma turonicum TaxID=216946 RepID=A0A0K1P617_9MOLU|nr:hypothetical protein [Spiroplasma turonicum]AKU79746.1 hypothetical protein STURON_00500 [Spiroplasma turonicum]ALX70764.1 hypothetical protein STURO_v1c04980 [Spiroplasma turonicum]
MMKLNSIQVIDEGYFLINENQTFRFDKEVAKNYIEKIEFPIIILDTEFFNYSHDINNEFEEKLYNENNKDLVYVVQYSFAKSLKEISSRDNKKAIKSISIKRSYNDSSYNFYSQYEKMIISFLNMCRNKDIRTIVCAGASNDIKIIKLWVNNNRKLFSKKPLKMTYLNKEKNELNVKNFDVYDILENCFSFSNTKNDGTEFWNKNNLPSGKQNDEMITLTSMKKFFDWFEGNVDNIFKNEKTDIYSMCCETYSFFSYPNTKKISFESYKHMNKTLKKVIDHCYNDVLKILIFLEFIYEFTYNNYFKNKFIKK